MPIRAFRTVAASVVFGLALASLVACHRGKRPTPAPTDSITDGYGRRDGRGVSSLTFDEARRRATHVEELLETVPGVIVQRTTDGGYRVRIRGVGSFMSSEEPLFVIDGTPIDARMGRGLAWLRPQDVDRIDVLKDPSQTTIYGVRGANGVIVVTTRRPR